MFAANSRYAKLMPYTVTLRDGRVVTATRLRQSPAQLPLAGYHTSAQGDHRVFDISGYHRIPVPDQGTLEFHLAPESTGPMG